MNSRDSYDFYVLNLQAFQASCMQESAKGLCQLVLILGHYISRLMHPLCLIQTCKVRFGITARHANPSL